MDKKYFITYHAVERLQERYGAFCSKIPEFKNWKKEHGTAHLKPLFDKMLENAEENRSYINNTNYMIKLYDRYGYDSEYCFLELAQADMLFVLTKARSEKNYRLVTLMPIDYRPSSKSIKYNDKLTKEAKYNKFIMDWYKDLPVNSAIKSVIRKEPLQLKISNRLESPPLLLPNTVDIIEAPLEIIEKLFDMVQSNKTTIIEKISNNRVRHSAIIDKKEYFFMYVRTQERQNKIKIYDVKDAVLENDPVVVNPEIIIQLKSMVLNDKTEVIENISNRFSLRRAVINNTSYEFKYIKTKLGEREIEIKKIQVLNENFNMDITLNNPLLLNTIEEITNNEQLNTSDYRKNKI
jgi:hypothetical protein